MSDFTASLLAKARAALVSVAMVLLTLAAATGLAWPQAAKPPPLSSEGDPAQAAASQAQAVPNPVAPQPGEPAPPAVPRAENPGLFNEIGKLFDNPSSILPPVKDPREAIDDFNARAKGAADALTRLVAPSIVKGRMLCPIEVSGAPDCKAASDKLCQTNGFKEGKSLDTDSAQSCPAAALLSGGNRQPGNCRTNNYVTRALCQ
jgi:hypothetical protein